MRPVLPRESTSGAAPRNTRKRVTIAQLADALGVTKGTVSRALNGYPDISDATRARVTKKASELGYQPLSHAQAIRTGRVRSLGLVLELEGRANHRPFLADFLAGVTSAASAEAWSLTVATAQGTSEMLDTLARLVREHKADGFILPRALLDDPRVAFLREEGVPFVLYGRTRDDRDCAWYDIASEEAMRDAVLLLAKAGHRRIGFVNSGLEYTYSWLRRDGFDAGMQAAGLSVDPELLLEGALTAAEGEAAAETLLDLPNPPTALVYATDLPALGLYKAAAKRGMVVGRDISVVAYDGIPEGPFAVPPLTTFSVDSRRAGIRLSELLIRVIRGEHPEDLRELAHARLVQGGSVGPPRPETASDHQV